jgi:hypothetical protein
MIMRASYWFGTWSHLWQCAASTGRGIFDQIPTLIAQGKNGPRKRRMAEQVTFLCPIPSKLVKLRSEKPM